MTDSTDTTATPAASAVVEGAAVDDAALADRCKQLEAELHTTQLDHAETREVLEHTSDKLTAAQAELATAQAARDAALAELQQLRSTIEPNGSRAPLTDAERDAAQKAALVRIAAGQALPGDHAIADIT